jgi:hypothetical protein
MKVEKNEWETPSADSVMHWGKAGVEDFDDLL